MSIEIVRRPIPTVKEYKPHRNQNGANNEANKNVGRENSDLLKGEQKEDNALVLLNFVINCKVEILWKSICACDMKLPDI